jgi:hypothetical protein
MSGRTSHTSAALLKIEVMMRLPAGLNAAFDTDARCVRGLKSCLLVPASHTRGPVPTGGNDTGTIGLNAALATGPGCSRGAQERLARGRIPHACGWSSLAVTIREPSGLNAALTTGPTCSSGFESGLLVAASPDARGVVPARGDDAGTIRAERGDHDLRLMLEAAGERLAGGVVSHARGFRPGSP